MRKIREILRLRHEKGLSQRAVAAACGMGAGTVSEYLSRAAQAGVHRPLPPELDDSVLEARLFPTLPPGGGRVAPDLLVLPTPPPPPSDASACANMILPAHCALLT